jgi:hypothetical protein
MLAWKYTIWQPWAAEHFSRREKNLHRKNWAIKLTKTNEILRRLAGGFIPAFPSEYWIYVCWRLTAQRTDLISPLEGKMWPQGRSWSAGINFVPKGWSRPLGLKTLCSPLRSSKQYVEENVQPQGVKERVNIPPKIKISPLWGAKFPPRGKLYPWW